MNRVLALIRKELQALWGDRQGRILMIVPVLMQLIVFSFAATLEVKNNTLGIFNQDGGQASAELIQRLARAKAFTKVEFIHSEAELTQTIESQRALLVVRFAPDFSRQVTAHRPAPIQIVLDGRRSNSGQVALGYVRTIVQDWQNELGTNPIGASSPPITVRHWFNPNLDYVRHIIPSLVAIITAISSLIVTALSVAREREQGTFDQLLVSPLSPELIMIGKTVPALIVASLQGTVILTAGVFLFRIPFAGSLMLLYGSMVFYILALAGFGLFISSIASTQQQAFLGVFSFLMPSVLLSGFPAPVENMPLWLQYIDWMNPLRHFIVVVKGVFLKDSSLALLWPSIWPLIIIAGITLTAAGWIFRKTR